MKVIFVKNELLKKVSMIELFYDLVFVYMISQVTGLIHHLQNGVISPSALSIFTLVVIVSINSWMVQTVFNNRYGKSQWSNVILSFVDMAIVLYMSNAFSDTFDRHLIGFFIAAGLLSLTLAIQYLLVFVQTKNEYDRNIVMAFMRILFFRTACLLAGGVLAGRWGTTIALFGIITSWIIPAFTGKHTQKHPIIFSHLLERLTALIIIMFGETIVGISKYFTQNTFSIQSIMIFIIVVSLFFTYIVEFDHLIEEQRTHETGNLLIYLHYFILFGLSLVTVALNFIHESEANAIFSITCLYVGIALFYIGIVIASYYNKTTLKLENYVVVAFIVVTLMGYFTSMCFATFSIIAGVTALTTLINAVVITLSLVRRYER